MITDMIWNWINGEGLPEGEEANWDYLPAYRGWSLSLMRQGAKTDILGRTRRTAELRVTRRITVSSNTGRLNALREMEELRAWALAHPPAGYRVRSAEEPVLKSRSNSGTEDFVMTLEIKEV